MVAAVPVVNAVLTKTLIQRFSPVSPAVALTVRPARVVNVGAGSIAVGGDRLRSRELHFGIEITHFLESLLGSTYAPP
jgi:hypothetical protein